MVYSTGLHINAKYPHLGAFPDGIIVSDRHGKGLLELQVPKWSKGWQDDKDFRLDESGQIKKDHIFCDFFIWTPLVANSLLVRAQRDADFI